MSSTMANIRDKVKRKLSMSDKNANVDDYEDPSDVDEETTGHLHREIEKAEQSEDKYPQGRPNSFLNRLISHGNKKTEDQIMRESQERLPPEAMARKDLDPPTTQRPDSAAATAQTTSTTQT